MLEAETWLGRSTNQIATKRLPTCGFGCVLHMNSLRRERKTAGYCLSDLMNLLRESLAYRPMGLKDCDKGRQLLRGDLTLVLCIGR